MVSLVKGVVAVPPTGVGRARVGVAIDKAGVFRGSCILEVSSILLLLPLGGMGDVTDTMTDR